MTPKKPNQNHDEGRHQVDSSVSPPATTPTRPERRIPQGMTPGQGAQAAHASDRAGSSQMRSEVIPVKGVSAESASVEGMMVESPITQGQQLPSIRYEDTAENATEGKEVGIDKGMVIAVDDPPALTKSGSAGGSGKGTEARKVVGPYHTSKAWQTSASNGTKQPIDLVSPPSNSVRPTRSAGSRALPQLPSAKNVLPAPPPAMYWSKASVHGNVPRRSFRAHTASLSDEVLWLFGGCDAKGCFHDLYCFDTETMCWSKPKVTGDIPPARRAHSATMVDKRLFVFAGGDGPYYFNDLYIFDTVALRWTKPEVFGQAPSPRRAHTSSYYDGQLIIFGGGNGVGALNDVYSLDISDLERLEWRKIECRGKLPVGRGYHTSNLVDGKLIVIGGSDGHTSFDDIQILRLDTKIWYEVKTDEIYHRLGHTATQVGSYLFVVGGHDSRSYTPEVLTLNLVNLQWEPRSVCGKKPPGRGYHQAWLRDGRLFLHGGFDGKEIFDDLYYMDLSACAYLPQITSFSVEVSC